MKKVLLFSIVCLVSLAVQAQKSYFIYLQSEGNVPFYMKLQDKVYSSSALGYMILPELADSTYTLSLGIPSAQAREGRFSIPIKGNDHGFMLQAADGGIQLFDLQTQNLIRPVSDPSRTSLTYESRSDAFSTLLSRAAGDPSLLYVPVVAKKEAKTEEKKEPVLAKVEEPKQQKEDAGVKATSGKDSVKTGEVTALQEPPVKNADKQDTLTAYVPVKKDTTTQVLTTPKEINTVVTDVNQKDDSTKLAKEDQKPAEEKQTVTGDEIAYKRTLIKKYSESSTSEGFGLVYIDQGESQDTVRLLIPNPKFNITEEPVVSTSIKTDTAQTVVKEKPTETKETPAEQKKSQESRQEATNKQLPIIPPAQETAEQRTDTLATKDIKVAATPLIKPVRPQCGNVATDKDFFKLRSAMAQRNSDEEMVEAAKKVFKSKCFSTEQVRNLGTLFLTSAGKYQFFDAAYLHVSDQEQFSSLQSEIRDDYYLKRFKALIGE